MTGFDYSSAAEEIERETGLTTFFVDTNGTHSYLQGAEGAFLNIAKLFCCEGKEKKEKKKTPVDEAVELVFQDMENRMKTVMGTKVNISRKDKSKGKIEIEYYSEAELERLVELIESIQPV